MQKEYDALIKNDTWKLAGHPLGTKKNWLQVGLQEQV